MDMCVCIRRAGMVGHFDRRVRHREVAKGVGGGPTPGLRLQG